MSQFDFNFELFAYHVQQKIAGRTLREAVFSDKLHTSPSTLSRIMNGATPDTDTLLVLCNWMGISPARFFNEGGPVTLELPPPRMVSELTVTEFIKLLKTHNPPNR